MFRIAQTNIQLYNQLRGQNRPLADLLAVHKAYEFCASIYASRYQADGKPFVCHCVGVASLLAELGRPADVVAAGLVHNIYGNGDFGDGREHIVTRARRRIAREAIGDRSEEIIYRFFRFRLQPEAFEDYSARLGELDAVERDLLLIEIGDCLEKYSDNGIHYFGDGGWQTEIVAKSGAAMMDAAARLGYPGLAAMLVEAFETTAASEGEIPSGLRPSDGRKHLTLVLPRSCQVRLSVSLRALARRAMGRLAGKIQPVTRLRRILSPVWNSLRD